MPHNPFGLEGRHAVVTGAPSPESDTISRSLSLAGATVATLPLQPGRDQARLQALGEVQDLDIFVNCAAAVGGKPIAEVTDAELTEGLDAFVRDSYLASQAAVRTFARRPRQDGDLVIIHVATPLARVGAANRAVATMAMHSLRGLTAAMAVELAPSGIRVNCLEVAGGDDVGEFALAGVPDADQVGSAVIYLASRAAAGMTGASLCLDAGWTAR